MNQDENTNPNIINNKPAPVIGFEEDNSPKTETSVEINTTEVDTVNSVTVETDVKVESHSVIEDGKEYLKTLGPGVITGAADDDPSGIATYSQTGAVYGFNFLWLAAWTFPLMATIQEMCARIALVTGRGLAANIKHMFSKKMLYACTILLFLANVLNIGADLGAMAKAIQLLFPTFNFTALIIVMGLVGLVLQIFVPYKEYARYLKWLAFCLLSYVITGFLVHMNWSDLFKHSFVPHFVFTKDAILIITGVLGTTISPYLFFWQTSQEVEEEIEHGKVTAHQRRGTNMSEVKKMRFDVWTGMFISNVVMFFIIAVCGATLHAHGITNITTAADAAAALRPLAGNSAYLLFAIGIIGTGMLAIPVLAGSAAYAISESFGWKEGLYRKLNEARAFYGVIIVAVIVGIVINFIGIDPIKALIYSAIANGIVAPIILVCIVSMSGSHKLMGKYRNSKFANFIGWSVVVIMSIAALAAIYSLF